MTQDSTPQPGWYPQGPGQERWWNGVSWSDAFRPAPTAGQPAPPPPAQPSGPPPGYGQAYYQPPRGSSHTLRNVLLVVGLVLVLFAGGCVAVIAVAAHKVDTIANDPTPGGRNVAKTITQGQAFSVKDLDYAAGWAVSTDDLGSATVTGLTVTNHGDSAHDDFVYVDLRSSGTRVARIDCYADDGFIDPGDSHDLKCFSSDKLPTYDEITIRDQF